MALVWIAYSDQLPVQPGGMLAPVADLTGNIDKFTFSTSVASTAIPTGMNYATLNADAVCHIAAAASPTATVASFRIPANTVVTFPVTAGQKIAVYDGSS